MKAVIKKLVLLYVFIALPVLDVFAYQVDTLKVYSVKMNKIVPNLIIKPADYKCVAKNYSVVYLLHGYGADYTTWTSVIKKDLPQLATKYQFIIVCPDGQNSWYWDSPINSNSQYDTYISKELVSAVDSLYQTIADAKGRAISGFSMGGHGALWLTLKHPNLFGACGSMSGGVDIRPFPKNWEMYKQLGNYLNNKSLWDSYTVATQIDKFKNKNKAIIIDCGESDFFIQVNNQLHQKMQDEGINHLYFTSPGGHTPSYWRQSIDKHLQFFSDYFKFQSKSNK